MQVNRVKCEQNNFVAGNSNTKILVICISFIHSFIAN